MRAAAPIRRRTIQLAKYCQAIMRHHGRIDRALSDLSVDPSQARRLTYALRHAGALRVMNVVDPFKLGRPVERVTWLRLSATSTDTVSRFEQALIDDPAVTCAQAVTGDADYRITTFHQSDDDALAWCYRLSAWPDVTSCRHATAERRFGHDLSGILLDKPAVSPSESPADETDLQRRELERLARTDWRLHRRLLAMARTRAAKL